MSRTRLLFAAVMVAIVLSAGLTANPAPSRAAGPHAATEVAQITGLNVIDTADADFLLLGGPVLDVREAGDFDAPLLFPVNVLAGVSPAAGQAAFFITDPLADTLPVSAGESFAVLCPQVGGAPDCTRLDGRPWSRVAAVSLVGRAFGSLDRNPQIFDLDGDGILNIVFAVPPTSAQVRVARTANTSAGPTFVLTERGAELVDLGQLDPDICETNPGFGVFFGACDLAPDAEPDDDFFDPLPGVPGDDSGIDDTFGDDISSDGNNPFGGDPTPDDDPTSDDLPFGRLGPGQRPLTPVDTQVSPAPADHPDALTPLDSLSVQQVPVPSHVLITIWEPGAEPAFGEALFVTRRVIIVGIPGADGAGGRVEMLVRSGGVETPFDPAPVRTVRADDPAFGGTLAVSGQGRSGFCAGACVAVGAAAGAGDSSVWLIDAVLPFGPQGADEQIDEAQPWAARISGIPNGHRGLALELADVNLDGALDLLIGVPGADSADVQAAQAGVSDEAGVVYVVEGPLESGTLAQLATRAYVGPPGELFGGDLDVAGINLDGLPDLVVTARLHKSSPFAAPTGALYGFLGTPDQVVEVVAQTRSVSLVPGLNLVGWTGDTAILDATASIAGLFSQILGWDAAAQGYVSFIPGLPAAVQGLTDVNTGDSFWIVMDQAATWEQPAFNDARSVALLAGLNLAMWTGPAMDIEAALAGLDAADAVFRWNGVGYDTWRRGAPVGNMLETLANGDAFFIRLTAAATWEQPAN